MYKGSSFFSCSARLTPAVVFFTESPGTSLGRFTFAKPNKTAYTRASGSGIAFRAPETSMGLCWTTSRPAPSTLTD